MKRFISLSLFLFAITTAFSQQVVQDSVKWVSLFVDKQNPGKESCKHQWIYSEEYYQKPYSLHKAICSICKRFELQQKVLYFHVEKPIESDFQKLEKELKVTTFDDNKYISVLEASVMSESGSVIELASPVQSDVIKEED